MKTYVIQAGDTLSLLAPRLLGPGSTWQDLWYQNPQIFDPNVLRVGEVITYSEPSSFKPMEFLKSPVFLFSLAGLITGTAIVVSLRKKRTV